MLLPKTPFSRANYFGIHISHNYLRAIELGPKGEVVRAHAAQFTQPIIQGEYLIEDPLIAGLKQLRDQAGFTLKYAAVGIPETLAYSRSHTFPPLPKEEVSESLQWQVEKIFPFSVHEIYFDWRTLEKSSTEHKVNITVIPKTIIDQLKHALQASTIFPISFEPSASALSRAVQASSSAQLLLQVDQEASHATLLANTVSLITTSVNHPGITNSQDKITCLLKPIQSLLGYAETNRINVSALTMLLTGEAVDQAFAQQLTANTNLDCQLIDIQGLSPADHVAYAVAHSQVAPPESDKTINLLPTSLQQYYQADISYTFAKAALWVVSLLSALSLFISVIVFAILFSQTIQAQNSKAQIEAATQTMTAGQFNVAELNTLANRFVKLFPVKTTHADVYQLLFSLLPEGITISRFTHLPIANHYTLIGEAQSRQDLVELKRKIDETNKFSPIGIPISTLEIQENIAFEITFSLLPPKESGL